MALEALQGAPDHGFPARRFHAKQIEQLLSSDAAADQAVGEARLRTAIVDYARAQHGLTIPLGALPRAWSQRPAYDADAELNAAIRGGTMRAWLDALPPPTPAYQALQAAYLAARDKERPRPRVEAGPLDLGEQDARTKALRKRLALEDPSLADTGAEAPADEDLTAALMAYQLAHRLEPTGLLDEATAARLNTPVMSKTDRLRANMERLRWLPRPEPGRRIVVNIAAQELDYFRDDGGLETHMLVVSGKIGDETPLVASAIDSIVLNPPWYVPSRIAYEEIAPRGAAYLRARHFHWANGRLVQRPGRGAALGVVKFDFPNPYGVYLHDTPTRSTFARSERTASHGCVRLERAVELARTLEAEEPGSSPERVDRLLASGKTARLKLSRTIPVRLVYFTAVPKDGGIAYLPDVYGWDGRLLALLDRYQGPADKSAPSAGGRAERRSGSKPPASAAPGPSDLEPPQSAPPPAPPEGEPLGATASSPPADAPVPDAPAPGADPTR
jgi:murein L,D-transpeptidase YcbB/YkuD